MGLLDNFRKKKWLKYHNANFEETTNFINREADLKWLEKRVFTKADKLISVRGEGGIGKTSLVQKFVKKIVCGDYSNEELHAIVYMTAKSDELRVKKDGYPSIISKKRYRKNKNIFVSNIKDVFKKILEVSEHPDFQKVSPFSFFRTPPFDEEKVINWLTQKRTLIIIDDFDQISGYAELMSFFENFPSNSTAIITTRLNIRQSTDVGISELPIGLLGTDHIKELIVAKIPSLKKEKELQEKISLITKGNPLLTITLCGVLNQKIKNAQNINKILNEFKFNKPSLKFLYYDLIFNLNPDSKRLLLAICILKKENKSFDKDDLAKILGKEREIVEYRLEELEFSSLIDRDKKDNDDFDVHQILIDYTMKINKEDTEFYRKRITDLGIG